MSDMGSGGRVVTITFRGIVVKSRTCFSRVQVHGETYFDRPNDSAVRVMSKSVREVIVRARNS